MKENKISSRAYEILKSMLAALVLPVLIIYIMVAKPDYRIMNSMAHVVVPVAGAVGDFLTWPVRILARGFVNSHDIASLREENAELRARLDTALANKNACDIAIAENAKLSRELDLVLAQPRGAIMANIRIDNSVLNRSTFLIDKGTNSNVAPGMVVVSPDNNLIGVIIDAGANYARVRALTDSDSNIAVRIAGTDIYGFLQGDGSKTPRIKFFNDPNFHARGGEKLITSSISGILPAGVMVGEMIDERNVRIVPYKKLSRVMVLQFDTTEKYQ